MTVQTVPGAAWMPQAQRGFRSAINDALLNEVVIPIQRLLINAATQTAADGQTAVIPPSNMRRILQDAGDLVQRFFVGPDMRHPFAANGVEPLATYPRILNTWLAWVTYKVAESHEKLMRRFLPADILAWLNTEYVSEQFTSNPLAQYDAPHTWVDPRGYTLSDRIWQAGIATRTRIDLYISEGIRNGRGALLMSRGLEQYLLPERRAVRTNRPYGTDASYHAMVLGRTEITRAHTEASYVAALANPFTDIADFALSAQHPKFDICDKLATIGMNGERLKDPYPLESAPRPVKDTHPQCVLPGTLIQFPNAVLAATQTHYRGLVIEVRTRNGRQLTITPNHPILTGSGWVAAQNLQEGDQVFIAFRRQGVVAGIHPDNDDVPPTAEQVFRAFNESKRMVPRFMPATPKDFHSDGRFMDGDVHIVDVDSFLLGDLQTQFPQAFAQFIFDGGGIAARNFLGLSHLDLGSNRFGDAASGVMGGLSHSMPLNGGHTTEGETLRLAAHPNLDPTFSESAGECGTRVMDGVTDRFETFPMLIAEDEVVNVRNRHFTGHVYNFQVQSDEWYTANSIITHNCLCTFRPGISQSPAEIVENLRTMLNEGMPAPVTPVNSHGFLRRLLGGYLSGILQVTIQRQIIRKLGPNS